MSVRLDADRVCCSIMNAGSATQITEFDTWMPRDWWRHLESRYGY
ncbi:hypothetical protein [Microbispora sp. H10830]|nr:hypothetical protein [Microbispora sp. H10830]